MSRVGALILAQESSQVFPLTAEDFVLLSQFVVRGTSERYKPNNSIMRKKMTTQKPKLDSMI